MRYLLASALIFLVACGSDVVSPVPSIADARGEVVFDGNSLTAAHGGHIPYPDFVMQDLGNPLGLDTANVAVSGQTTLNMIARGPTFVDPLHTTKPVNVLVVWEGTNDMYFGATPEEAYAHLISYAAARKADGWKIVVLTIMPRAGLYTRPDFEVVRQQFNTLLRANWQTFADQFADIALDPRFGAPGAQEDTMYFEDETHLTQYGISEMAHLTTPAVRRAILSAMR